MRRLSLPNLDTLMVLLSSSTYFYHRPSGHLLSSFPMYSHSLYTGQKVYCSTTLPQNIDPPLLGALNFCPPSTPPPLASQTFAFSPSLGRHQIPLPPPGPAHRLLPPSPPLPSHHFPSHPITSPHLVRSDMSLPARLCFPQRPVCPDDTPDVYSIPERSTLVRSP